MKNRSLPLFIIIGMLISGTILGQQSVFASSNELEVKIMIRGQISEIEVEFEDKRHKFKIATSNIDEILEITSLRTGISVDLLEEAMTLQINDESDDASNNTKDDTDNNSNDIKTNSLEKKLRASTIGDSSEVKIELEFITTTLGSELLIDEILENFLVTQEEAEGALKIQKDDDNELEEKFVTEIKMKNNVSEIKVELRYVLDSIDRNDIIASIVDESKLDRDLLADSINAKVESDDTFDRSSNDTESALDDDSELEKLRAENDKLRKENQIIHKENNSLREMLANLNNVLREQIRVILDTLTALRS